MTEQPTDEMPTEEEIKLFEEMQEHFEDAHYLAIGKGITAWSRNEGFLVFVASMLLDTEIEKAGLVLYSMNFYSWLSIIDELFAMSPRYQALRSDWNKIAERLKKLNDTRVQFAHNAIEPGKGVMDFVAAGLDEQVLWPALKAHEYDTRSKSRKQPPLRLDQLVAFVTGVAAVSEDLVELMRKMSPIHIEPKKRLAQKVRELQQKVADLEAKKGS